MILANLVKTLSPRDILSGNCKGNYYHVIARHTPLQEETASLSLSNGA